MRQTLIHPNLNLLNFNRAFISNKNRTEVYAPSPFYFGHPTGGALRNDTI